MVNDESLPELHAFRTFEETLPLWYTPKYGPLVVATGNDDRRIHRWFRFKEGFAADLLQDILIQLGYSKEKRIALLDPFSGSGTTLLSADLLRDQGWNISASGIEVNPFIHFVAQTKLGWSEIDADKMLAGGEAALSRARRLTPRLPSLTSISEERCIDASVAKQLLAVRNSIPHVSGASEQAALLLGVAACIEPLSKVRKDGRALRLVRGRAPADVAQTLRSKWTEIAEDVRAESIARTGRKSCLQIKHGDGRNPQSLGYKKNSLDLIVTSPPYPNNIDYTEVYKLELWMMGCVETGAQFLNQRRLTMRSHPTCAPVPETSPVFEQLSLGELEALVAPVLGRMEKTRDAVRRRVLIGYCADLYESLKNYFSLLRPSGFAVFVVGNSLHGSDDAAFLFASDLLIAAIAKKVGFEVREIHIARSLKRRLSGNHFLRESVIVLRKPHA